MTETEPLKVSFDLEDDSGCRWDEVRRLDGSSWVRKFDASGEMLAGVGMP